jgi:AcrR family transcriptional regulator
MAYHHGDLRETILRTAVEAIAEHGPAALSLRDLARRAGVSHAAPAHHFRDKAGLLTAVAVEGFESLSAALSAAADHAGSFLDVGVAYVQFALEHRAHFEVMYRPDLYHADAPDLVAARARAGEALHGGIAALPTPPPDGDPQAAALAAWSLVHGFATLWLSGALPHPDPDPLQLARRVAAVLFASE